MPDKEIPLAEEAKNLISEAEIMQILTDTADYDAPIEYYPEKISQNRLSTLLREDDPEDREFVDIETGEIVNEVDIIPRSEIVKVDVSEEDKRIDIDFEKAHKNVDGFVSTAKGAIGDLLALARASDNPDVYMALNGLLKTASDINGQILELHVKKKKAKAPVFVEGSSSAGVLPGAQNQQNNFFVGTTADLALMLKDAKKLGK